MAAPAAPNPPKNAGTKIALAIGMLVIAGLVFAWSQGLIFASKPAPPAPPSADEKVRIDQAQKRMEEAKKSPPAGSY
jgi:hypothetical protein